eukprot:Rhum_TRINITY_DN14288_c13_g1::Rhum_TRINITY_DN14288_c13_g1_i1::g.74066::m.74066
MGGKKATSALSGSRKGKNKSKDGLTGLLRPLFSFSWEYMFRALVLFAVFMVFRFVAEQELDDSLSALRFGAHDATDSLAQSRTSEKLIERLYRVGTACLDHGMLHDAVAYFDYIAVLHNDADDGASAAAAPSAANGGGSGGVGEAPITETERLVSNSLILRGGILLAYAARAMRLDPHVDYLRFERVRDARSFLAEWDADGSLSLHAPLASAAGFVPVSYTAWPQKRLLDEAVSTLSDAADKVVTGAQLADLTANLGLAVVTSQSSNRVPHAKSAGVVQEVMESLAGIAASARLHKELATLHKRYTQTGLIRDQLRDMLRAREGGVGYLHRIQGLGPALAHSLPKRVASASAEDGAGGESVWEAAVAAEEAASAARSVPPLAGFDAVTVLSGGEAGGLARAKKNAEQYEKWAAKKGRHLTRLLTHYRRAGAAGGGGGGDDFAVVTGSYASA